MSKSFLAVGLSGCLAVVTAAGCGSGDEHPVGTVSGSVMFKDQPLPEGVLYVYNRETGQAGEGQVTDGKFELLTELRAGNYVVFVTAIPPPPPNPENPPVDLWGKFPADVPEKYQREDMSDLRIEVKEGHNDVEIVIPAP